MLYLHPRLRRQQVGGRWEHFCQFLENFYYLFENLFCQFVNNIGQFFVNISVQALNSTLGAALVKVGFHARLAIPIYILALPHKPAICKKANKQTQKARCKQTKVTNIQRQQTIAIPIYILDLSHKPAICKKKQKQKTQKAI